MIKNAFRLDKSNEFCLTTWLESAYDFLEIDETKKLVTMQVPAEHDEQEDYDDEAFLVFQLRSHQFKVQIITEVEAIKATDSEDKVESEN